MACNCKKKMVLEDKHGIKEEETLLGKINRYIWKVVIFVLLIGMACVLIPVMLFLIVYQIVFKKEPKIVLPNFLGKYMK